jgi:ATPase subunit of ABC transporter with duplicated ATPase domains
MASASDLSAVIASHAPWMDEDVVTYLGGMVADMPSDDRFDFIFPFFDSFDAKADARTPGAKVVLSVEDRIRLLCGEIDRVLSGGVEPVAEQKSSADGATRLLAAPVKIPGVPGAASAVQPSSAPSASGSSSSAAAAAAAGSGDGTAVGGQSDPSAWLWGTDVIRRSRNAPMVFDSASAKRTERELERERRAWLRGLESGFSGVVEPEDQVALMNAPNDGAAGSGASNAASERDIHVTGVTVNFGGQQLLVDAELRFVYGRRYGLIGRNGVGKTTLLRHIATGDIEGFPRSLRVLHVRQEVKSSEKPVLEVVMSADVEREQLLAEEREIMHRQQAETEPSDVSEASEAQATRDARRLAVIYSRLDQIGSDTAETRAATILAGMQFTPAMQAGPMSALSGGWRMRVAIASALFIEPDLLMLDEPTNHLDLETVIWLQEYLKNYPHTLLVVSHDREFLNEVTTDIVHFASQRLDYYRGNFDGFEQGRAERMRTLERQHESQEVRRQHMQEFVDRFRYNAKRAALVQSRIKAIDKMEDVELLEEEERFRFQIPSPVPLSGSVIEAVEMGFWYDGTEGKVSHRARGIEVDEGDDKPRRQTRREKRRQKQIEDDLRAEGKLPPLPPKSAATTSRDSDSSSDGSGDDAPAKAKKSAPPSAGAKDAASAPAAAASAKATTPAAPAATAATAATAPASTAAGSKAVKAISLPSKTAKVAVQSGPPDGARLLFRYINMGIDTRSRVGVVGANGAGKSTLLNLLMGKLLPKEGSVIRNGGARVAVFTQHHMDLFDLSISPLQNMMNMFPNYNTLGTASTTGEQELRGFLGRFQISGADAVKPMQFLSGGQKSRVAFAQLAYRKPHLVIMDEPTNHLDMDAIDALIEALTAFTGGVVLVSHDQHFISSVCSEIWVVGPDGQAASRAATSSGGAAATGGAMMPRPSALGPPPFGIVRFPGSFQEYREHTVRMQRLRSQALEEEQRAASAAAAAAAAAAASSASASTTTASAASATAIAGRRS